jgi:hypothetical protein
MNIIECPQDWRDLQNKVGLILKQSNFSVEIEKKISSIRSLIEIDVYAEEKIDDRIYTILCECKMWKSNIPQLYVHGLRTVVSDIGANKGYIITTSNFQQGSKDSISNTNIELITWNDFQSIFFKSWYINFFSPTLVSFTFSDYDPASIQFFEDYEAIPQERFRLLVRQYHSINRIVRHFPHYIHKEQPKEFSSFSDRLPLSEKLFLEDFESLDYLEIPFAILEEKHYSNFLVLLKTFADPIYEELDKLNLFFDYED